MLWFVQRSTYYYSTIHLGLSFFIELQSPYIVYLHQSSIVGNHGTIVVAPCAGVLGLSCISLMTMHVFACPHLQHQRNLSCRSSIAYSESSFLKLGFRNYVSSQSPQQKSSISVIKGLSGSATEKTGQFPSVSLEPN
ncbi:hypothetical protein Hypma_008542 [Hypsizygus marmoreus]|uniref:Uncharacterized protein n=1 Tax=Hypsizygus marmoreus TaxID=39966 RepID=A0A369JU89_HYPMA|nr:hypothetical protein Hypma_008542 [Hypsizygus marmoreus]